MTTRARRVEDDADPTPVSVLILAAGGGTRFGEEPKLLAPVAGRPLLQHVVDAAGALSEARNVVVVLGAHADRVLAEIEFGRADPIVCRNWSDGISASLRCGVAALPKDHRFVVLLGDSPTVTPALLRRFIGMPGGTRAVYGGRPGHPVVLGPVEVAALSRLRGDSGARRLLRGPLVECGDLASGQDIDRPEDLFSFQAGGLSPAPSG